MALVVFLSQFIKSYSTKEISSLIFSIWITKFARSENTTYFLCQNIYFASKSQHNGYTKRIGNLKSIKSNSMKLLFTKYKITKHISNIPDTLYASLILGYDSKQHHLSKDTHNCHACTHLLIQEMSANSQLPTKHYASCTQRQKDTAFVFKELLIKKKQNMYLQYSCSVVQERVFWSQTVCVEWALLLISSLSLSFLSGESRINKRSRAMCLL